MDFWQNDTAVRFPNLGIEFSGLPRGISIGDFTIAFYGVIIAIGMLSGLAIARWKARKTGQNQEIYLDFALWAIPLSVVGARLYYVIFDWGSGWTFWDIFNLRRGGLAIYGGVIVAVLSVLVFGKIRKLRLGLMADTGIIGLILGQIIGRWGNFFNRECFGKYTDSLFAMQIETSCPSLSSEYTMPEELLRLEYAGQEDILNNILEIRNNTVVLEDGRQFIQVHPCFLYESVWNLALLFLMLFAWKRKKFNGEILLIYLSGYGIGRFFVEGLRTDQLLIWGTGLAVSQVLSALLAVVSLVFLIVFRVRAMKSGSYKNVSMELSAAAKLPVSEKEGEISDGGKESPAEEAVEAEEAAPDGGSKSPGEEAAEAEESSPDDDTGGADETGGAFKEEDDSGVSGDLGPDSGRE